MKVADREFVAELCAAKAGLGVDAQKAYLIESRLAPVARREGYAAVGDLVAALRAEADERLIWLAVEAMAVADSAFFQDGDTLAAFWAEVVPELARRRGGGEVRIWSAGCGAGQEVYSLAMLAAEAPPAQGQVQLFASDLSERQLERARSGLYSHFEVQRGLSARRLVRHFENREDQFQIARGLREQVRWRRVNLMDDAASLGGFDVVLCRQALSAMTEAGRARALANLAGALAPDGILLLGPADAAPPAWGLVPIPDLAGAFAKPSGVRAAA